MKTLLDPQVRAEVDARIALLEPDSARLWGRMSASQMICHLSDAFRGVLGERSAAAEAASPGPAPKVLLKWVALYLPLPWPHGLPTPEGADQEKGGTPPSGFEEDRRALELLITRFLDELTVVTRRPHFAFGHLTAQEWARWGYRHVDHHLRQFGI